MNKSYLEDLHQALRDAGLVYNRNSGIAVQNVTAVAELLSEALREDGREI